ncbi:MAG TPA: segregation and condensation protein B, partial [Verrucomicrobiota bacterium]|nr:segregation and condensation protein B [Verrucomicrobiota bacterium]
MELKHILEALLFSAQKPLSASELRDVLTAAAEQEDANPAAKPFKKVKEAELNAALEELLREHEQAARSYRLVCVAGA